MKESQCKDVLNHLQLIGGISARYASKQYGIDRLAARIHDLRKDHPLIHTQLLTHNDKTFAYYTLTSRKYGE